MKLPDKFRYRSKRNNKSYTFVPQSTIDLQRLVAQKAYWEKVTADVEEGRKTLIISDWTAWSSDKTRETKIQALLTQLLEQKFTIYLWNKNKLVALTDPTTFIAGRRKILAGITPKPNDMILQVAVKQLKKPIDQLLLLDDFELNSLIDPSLSSTNRTINIDALHHYLPSKTNPHPSTQINNKLNLTPLSITAIQMNDVNLASNKTLNRVKKLPQLYPKLRDVPINISPVQLELETNDSYSINQQLTALVQNGLDLGQNIKITPNQLGEIRGCNLNFDLYAPPDETTLRSAFHKMPLLKTLKIKNLNSQSIANSLSFVAGITDLNLDITINNLRLELNAESKLQRLAISGPYTKSSLKPTIEIVQELALSTISLSHCNIDSKSMGNLISPSLESLKLSNVSINQDLKLDFLSLKGIIIETQLNNNSLHIIQQAETSLETLCLLGDDFEDTLRSVTLSLPKLNECRVTKISIKVLNEHILKDSTKLQTLSIDGIELLDEALNLKGIKTLTLKCSSVFRQKPAFNQESINNLVHSLNTATQIETFELSYYALNLTEPLPFTSLHSLKLGCVGTLTATTFKHIIEKSSQLRTLELYHMDISGSLHDLSTLANLTSLTLLNCTLSPGQLHDLTRSKLHKVNLSFLNDINWSELSPLPPMEELSIYNCNITTNELKALLHQCISQKTLMELSLSHCGNIIFDEELKALLRQIDIVSGVNLDDNTPDLNSFLQDQQAPLRPRAMEDMASSPISSDTSGRPLESGAEGTRPRHNGRSDVANKAHGHIPKTIGIDADTTPDPNISFNLDRIFVSTAGGIDPALTRYRLYVFDTLILGKSFELTNTNACDWDERRTPGQRELNDVFTWANTNEQPTYYGKQSFQLDAEWLPIASLSPEENITHYHSDPPDANIEIKYSRRDNQYYIRSLSAPQSITLDFLVHDSKWLKPALSDKISGLVNQFLLFKAETLILPNANPSTKELLDAILDQRKGSCRHRAVAFKALMDAEHIPARVIANGCHMFVEIFQNNHWLRCELGGYNGELNIDEKNRPTPESDKQPATQSPPLMTHANMTYASERQLAFRQRFETWTVAKHDVTEAPLFIQQLLNSQEPKQLVRIDKEQMQHLNWGLQTQAMHTHHPIFCINSPEDLVCSAPTLKRNTDNSGTWQDKGGDLHDFLTQSFDPHAPPPILLIDYSKFSADDIARISNSLYDETAKADGTPLPKNIIIIGLIDPNDPKSYTGADFFSRFDKKIQCPVSFQAGIIPTLPELSDHPEVAFDPQDRYSINLSHSSAWLTKLMGGWIIKDGKPYFKPGELQLALNGSKPIELINPPENDPTFQHFWAQALLHNSIHAHGETHPLTQPIYISHGYDWSKVSIDYKDHRTNDAVVINPSLLHCFFNDYQFKNKQLTEAEGILEANANKTVSLYVTRDLSEDGWDELFTRCKKHNVSLTIACAPGVTLPEPLKTPSITTVAITAWDAKQAFTPTSCITTNDQDLLIATITQGQTDTSDAPWLIIDISECGGSDLFERIDGGFKDFTFNFNKKKQALLQLLDSGKKVILTGHYSTELIDELTPFLIKRHDDSKAKGQLILLNSEPIPSVPSLTHAVTSADKLHTLQAHGVNDNTMTRLLKENSNAIEALSYIELFTRLTCLSNHPDQASDLAFKGLDQLPTTIQLQDFNPNTSKDDAHRFMQQRKIAVDAALKEAPYVFLAGLTGVGKSRFVEKELTSEGRQLFQGESLTNLTKWAGAASDKDLILFLDEANLSPRQWSEFEGLFHHPRGIVIDGTYHKLSAQHKVVFAGNPLSYGDERQTSSLFKRHGNTVVFEPLSCAFIHENVLKPILNPLNLGEEKVNAIASEFFHVSQHLIHLSRDEVLISPRQLQMMALLVMDYCRQVPKATSQDIAQIARFHARQIARPLVPDAHVLAFDREVPFNPRPANDPRVSPINRPTKFLHTDSRETVRRQILDFLSLRECNRYDGLNRLVIEGEAGIGKTEMLIDLLVHQGFEERTFTPSEDTRSLNKNIFYRMPASMHPRQKERLLLQAFDEGALVLVDEINSVSAMEQLLNSLLDGRHPDTNIPSRPGFRLIGTQNPPTMAGRSIESPALASRTQLIKLDAYPTADMQQILCKMGLPEDVSQDMIAAFEFKRTEAQHKHVTPAPSFRDLIKQAEYYVAAHRRIENITTEPLVNLTNACAKPETTTNESGTNATQSKAVSDYKHRLREITANDTPADVKRRPGTPN